MRRLGYRIFIARTTWPRLCSSVIASAVPGRESVGPGFASFTHAICTCACVSPSGCRRLNRTVSYCRSLGSSHHVATMLLRAPFTSVSVVLLTWTSAAAWLMNDPGMQLVVVELPEQNSCVVFDIPTESMTILPLPLGFPDASSGVTALRRAIPSVRCADGGVLRPPAYSPPANPLYVLI